MLKALEDFCQFIADSPTAYHAVDQIANRLASLGFEPLDFGTKWDLSPEGSYFVQKNGFLAAIRLPKKKISKVLITLSHTDSPSLKIKAQGVTQNEGMTYLTTEVYGSPLLSSWLNRDLAIAGRIFGETEEGEVQEKLFFFDETPLIIPALALHLSEKESGIGSKQKELQALFATDPQSDFMAWLSKTHFFKRLLSFDLFLASNELPRYIGEKGDLLAAPRLDNLASAYATLAGLLNSQSEESTLSLALFYNHEEIGSKSAEGAYAPLFDAVFNRIAAHQKLDEEERLCVKENSFCLSVDVAHAFAPQFDSRFDPQHRCYINRGPAVKEHAAHKYASEASGKALVKKWAEKAQVPLQHFVGHSDVPCGSTVGPIFAAQTGITTVDIGIPILSMHSIREVMAPSDLLHLCQLLKCFYHHGK